MLYGWKDFLWMALIFMILVFIFIFIFGGCKVNKIEEKCCMYTDIIEAMGRDSLLEPQRAELHNEICDLLDIPHNATKHITGDLTGVTGRQLYSKLLKLKEELKTKSRKDIIMEELRSYRETWGSTLLFTKDTSAKMWNKLNSLNCSVSGDFILKCL